MPRYYDDAYLRRLTTTVKAHTPEGGIVPSESIFYPTGGGQSGDSGQLIWEGGSLAIANTVKAGGGDVALLQAEPAPMPPVGAEIELQLDWPRRHGHMRIHTALHLLSVVIPLPVSGGQIGADRGRLDFDMPEPPQDVAALEAALNALVERDLEISQDWITDEELLANPSMVKTMSVMPPMGQGRVRLVRIGSGADQIDLQPCGGTHVARTGEIGRLRIAKIEKKGKQNRRVVIELV